MRCCVLISTTRESLMRDWQAVSHQSSWSLPTPRTIERGEKLSKQDLIQALRRAGYVDSLNSNVWNGSFRETNSTVEITPAS